jgi:hypothetical protein
MAKTKDKSNVVERAKKFFDRIVAFEAEQRKAELDDIRFVGLLEQWPANIKQIRENDPNGSRPCLVVDKVNQYKNQIVNNIRQNRPGIKVRPVDDYADIEVAEVLQGIVRHIEDRSKADIAYDWAGECAVVGGVGYFRILTEYVADSFEQDIRIERIKNRFTVYFDDTSVEPDGSDAQKCLLTELVDREVFKEMYPDASPCDWQHATGDNQNTWVTEKEVRIAEYFHIEKVKDTLYQLEDGSAIYKTAYEEKFANQQAPMVINERPQSRKVVKWCKLTADEVLESTVIPCSFIPVIKVIGIETDIDGKSHYRGIVRGVKDAQRMYNYNRSTIAENLNLTIKAPYIGYTGQFKTSGDKWAAANRNNYAYLEADPVTVNGNLAPLPQRQGFAGVPAGLMADIQTSEHDIQSALGMYQASIGQDSDAKSGRALNAQRQQGDMATFHFPDNLSKSIRHAGRVIVDMIPKIYDTTRVVRILGEDGSTDYARLDPSNPEAVSKQQNERGEIEKIYNIGVGTYDVTVTTGSSYATKRQEGAEFITQLVQTSPDLMPIVGDLLFKSMDMPYSEDIADRLKKMMPPQLQEQEEGGDSQEVTAIKQQAQQVIDQLQQQLQAAEQAMDEAEQEAQQLVAKAENAQGKAEIDAAKIALDDKKLELEARKIQIEEQKLELEGYKAQTERQEMQGAHMEAMQAMPEYQDMQNVNSQAIQQLLVILAQQQEQANQPKNKVIEIVAPSGKVYTGQVSE